MYGANPNIEFLNGKTALENAMDNGFYSVVDLSRLLDKPKGNLIFSGGFLILN